MPNLVKICLVVLEKKILKLRKCIFVISSLSPLGKGEALRLNTIAFPQPKDALCQVWLKFVQRFLRIRFWNSVDKFSLFRHYPLGKGRGSSFEQTLMPFTQGCLAFCKVWLKLALFTGFFMKMCKVYNNDTINNDNDDDIDYRQRTHFVQKSSLEPSAQVS